jgi:protein-tyrosine phosphatase
MTLAVHPFELLTLPRNGKLIFTPCPGTKGVALQDSLDQLKRAGASALITMMPDEELHKIGVMDLPASVVRSGMQWYQLPVDDDAAPTESFQQQWLKNRHEIMSSLARGDTIAVHCRGGSGRTGLMAAILISEQEIDASTTTTLVRSLRPNSLKLSSHLEYLESHYWNTAQQ